MALPPKQDGTKNPEVSAKDLDELQQRLRLLEEDGVKNAGEIKTLRGEIQGLEVEKKDLTEHTTKLKSFYHEQLRAKKSTDQMKDEEKLMQEIEDTYGHMDQRFDLDRPSIEFPPNERVLEAIVEMVQQVDFGSYINKPSKDDITQAAIELFRSLTTTQRAVRHKRIDRKCKRRMRAVRTLIESLEKNPNMRNPPLTLTQLRLIQPTLKAAYMSSDEEMELEEEGSKKGKRTVLATRRLPWESKDFALAKSKLDSFYFRILNPKTISESSEHGKLVSNRRLVKNAPSIVTDQWLMGSRVSSPAQTPAPTRRPRRSRQFSGTPTRARAEDTEDGLKQLECD